ncbi:membrane protein [Desulfosarcina alkanivorans]|jgi:acetoin utilization protein AcuB|uniref:Membrane protein n=1 Tax=Desulfosarcina alkanivorans TaxID=571177 RepID=A0A5K7YMS0_9BACT|nr:CBS domain-containing protein [Desulfosarcina alkanivorans]BBO71052.1 membrane protein [Desulfosarcina alkanivorans]
MFINKFMTKDVVTVNVNDDIVHAKRLMVRYRIRHLPVTQPDRVLIGIITDRDIRSAMPSSVGRNQGPTDDETDTATGILVQDIMTKDPVSISLASTIQDALLLVEKTRVGAFPVVDEHFKVVGIVSDRDLLNAFIDVLGIKEPGALLGVVIDEKPEEIENIVHAIITENIAFGSILVYRGWRPGKEAVFPYLFAKNVTHLKQKLTNMGYDVLDPIEWYAERAA